MLLQLDSSTAPQKFIYLFIYLFIFKREPCSHVGQALKIVKCEFRSSLQLIATICTFLAAVLCTVSTN
jgi:hypothetical protein